MLTEALRRLRQQLLRAVIRRVDDDAGALQEVQIGTLAGQVRDGIQRVQQYGFTSRPLAGAEAVVVQVGAAPDHLLVLAVDDRRYRPGLQAGEVALYTPWGLQVRIKPDGAVEITGGDVSITAAGAVAVDAAGGLTIDAGGAVSIDGGSISITGSTVTIAGPVTIDGKPFLTHTHSGVSSGGSNTGPPN